VLGKTAFPLSLVKCVSKLRATQGFQEGAGNARTLQQPGPRNGLYFSTSGYLSHQR